MRRPLLSVCICLFVIIALVKQLVSPPPFIVDKTGWNGQRIQLSGQVYQKEFRVSFGEEKLLIYLKSKELSQINPIENIICEINVNNLPEGDFVPSLGNMVEVTGTWRSLGHATNPGEFDAANYYAIEGICAKIQDAEILSAETSYWPIRENLYQCRQYLLENLYRAYPENEASILAKMLLGDGSGLDKDIKNLYQSNGIVHILSISGLHITMLGMGLYRLLRKLYMPIIPAAVCGGIGILLYGLMTGFGVSACRAIGMYMIHMLGEIWGKTYDMLTAMGVLGLGMLVENPMLSYHSGFLLSFSSVCGVGLLSPIIQLPYAWFGRAAGDNKFKLWGKKKLKSISDSLIVSLSVTIFTLPIQLYFFYKIPLYSVLINLLIIPFMSVLMVTGMIVMTLPMLPVFSYVGIGVLNWFEWLCLQFERLPGHTLIVGKPSIWKVVIYYMVLIVIIVWTKRIKKALFIVILSALLVMMLLLPEREGLIITILDVGQGDCICVQTPQGGCYLFDGGSSSRQNIAQKVILPYLLHQGIASVDGVFLSHADSDHSNGLKQLMEQKLIPVKTLYLPDVNTMDREAFEEILSCIDKTEVEYIKKGDCWKAGKLNLTCLHPDRGFCKDGNAYSACFWLEYGEFSMLFTGDVEGEGEALLLQEIERRDICQADVLKVAHHGSRHSTTEAFLQVVKPKVALISSGRNNSYGHPHKETLQRLEQVDALIFNTSKSGAIQIYETMKGMQMTTYNIDFGR